VRIRNLVSWSGPNFDYGPGDVLEVADAVAQARIVHGLAEPVAAEAAALAPPERAARPPPRRRPPARAAIKGSS